MAGNGWARNIQRQIPAMPTHRRRRRRVLAAAKSRAQSKFRNLRLKARRRVLPADGGTEHTWLGHAAPVLACVAMIAGYALAIRGDFDMGGSLMAPFVLVALYAMLTMRMSLTARMLGITACVMFLWLAWVL
jgi:hypothetical protein